MKNLKFFLIILFFFGCQSAATDNAANSSVKNAAENVVNNQSVSNETQKTPESSPTVEESTAENNNIESVYTDLDYKKCKTVESNVDEGGFYIGECAGFAGYKIELTAGDARSNINLIAPNGKKFILNFNRVSAAFSEVGAKAEWRVKDKKPFALIVRFNAFEDTENPDKSTSRLIVSKITDSNACITDVVEQTANANEKARELADASADKSCKFK